MHHMSCVAPNLVRPNRIQQTISEVVTQAVYGLLSYFMLTNRVAQSAAFSRYSSASACAQALALPKPVVVRGDTRRNGVTSRTKLS